MIHVKHPVKTRKLQKKAKFKNHCSEKKMFECFLILKKPEGFWKLSNLSNSLKLKLNVTRVFPQFPVSHGIKYTDLKHPSLNDHNVTIVISRVQPATFLTAVYNLMWMAQNRNPQSIPCVILISQSKLEVCFWEIRNICDEDGRGEERNLTHNDEREK